MGLDLGTEAGPAILTLMKPRREGAARMEPPRITALDHLDAQAGQDLSEICFLQGLVQIRLALILALV